VSYTKKIKAGLVPIDPSEFIGDKGTIFYDFETGVMALSDGITPGGTPLASGNGPRGYTGSAGSGYTGSTGVGYTGSTGVGYTGSAGSGYTGSTGVGYTGSTGVGYTGSAGLGIGDFGRGFTNTLDNGKITTSKLYNENPNPGLNNQYTLEVTNGGVVALPDGSIINGATLKTVPGNYAGITAGPASPAGRDEDSWVWVDNDGATIATKYSTSNFQWKFDNDGNLTFPNGGKFNDPYGDGAVNLSGNQNLYAGLVSYDTKSWIGVVDATYSQSDFNVAGGGFFIQTDIHGALNTWAFNAIGGLTFPDNTVQTTAYPGNVTIVQQDTAPTASNGELWFNTVEGRLYIKYSNQWIDAAPLIMPVPDTDIDVVSITFADASVQTTAFTGVAATGYTGSLGYTGYTGSVGNIGYTGSFGNIGYTGSFGNIGYTGSFGNIGYTGSFGNIGYTGSSGGTGNTLVNGSYIVSLEADGNLTLPAGSTLGETANTIVISPPGATSGQSLVIRPTNTWSLTSDHPSGFAPGDSITITFVPNAGSYVFGNAAYTFTDCTEEQLGRSLTGSLAYQEDQQQALTWTIPSISNITSFTFTIDNIVFPGSADPFITLTRNGSVSNEPGHLHLVAGNPTTVDLYLGDDNQYVKIEKNGGNVVVGTNTNTNHWTFGTNSTLTFPDATVQTTAWPGSSPAPTNGDGTSGNAWMTFYADGAWQSTSKVTINPVAGMLTLSGTGGAGGITLPNSGVIDVGLQLGTTPGLIRKIYSEYLGGYALPSPTYSELVAAIATWTADATATVTPIYWTGIIEQTWELTGYFRAPEAGTYTFNVSADDYYFIVIDGDIDPVPEVNTPAVVVLTQGQVVSYKVLYANVAGSGTLDLQWKNTVSQISYTSNFSGLIAINTGGTVDLTIDNSKWVFGTDGSTTLPTVLWNYVPTTFTAIPVTFGQTSLTFTVQPNNTITNMSVVSGAGGYGPNSFNLTIPGTTFPGGTSPANDIMFNVQTFETAGPVYSTDPTSAVAYVSGTPPPRYDNIASAGSVGIGANNSHWTFGSNGNLTLPAGGTINNSGGTVYKVAPTYGSFHSNVTQTNTSVGNAIPISYNVTDLSNGVNITGAGATEIRIAAAGVYNIQFSLQVRKTDSGADTVYIWLDKNGSTVDNSGTALFLTGSGAAEVAAWNFVVNAAANDYYRLMWMSTDSHVEIVAVTPGAVVPAIPSVILTVVPVGT